MELGRRKVLKDRIATGTHHPHSTQAHTPAHKRTPAHKHTIPAPTTSIAQLSLTNPMKTTVQRPVVGNEDHYEL